MRIIAGKYKGRKLKNPYGGNIRPTGGKVRESIFDLLMNDIAGAVCMDLFAGTGGLGLEALSRGAKKCYFCDDSRESMELIKTNVAKCGAQNESVLLFCDYTRALYGLRERADIFLLDPPYKEGLYEKCLGLIDSLDLLTDDGIIIAEHGAGNPLPVQVGRLLNTRNRKYGTVVISIYKRKDTAGE